MLKKGKKHTEIAEAIGISKHAADRISSMHRKKGTSYIKEKKRGRKFGEKHQPASDQEKEIQHLIIDKCPDQFKMNFMLWTRAAVCQLIKEKHGITYYYPPQYE